MKKLISFFTGNWGLKLLAFVLAIVVYYSMKETTRMHSRRSPNAPAPIFLKGPMNGGS